MDRWLKLLELPWSADLNFTISEEMLEAILKEAVGEKIQIKEVRCREGFISIAVKKLLTVTLELAVESIRISRNECVLVLRDVKGNISIFSPIINLLPFPLKVHQGGLIDIDLSDKIQKKIALLPKGMVECLDRVNLYIIVTNKEMRISLVLNSV